MRKPRLKIYRTPLDTDTPPTSVRLTPRLRSADLHLSFNMHVCVSPSWCACLSPLAALAEPAPPTTLGSCIIVWRTGLELDAVAVSLTGGGRLLRNILYL